MDHIENNFNDGLESNDTDAPDTENKRRAESATHSKKKKKAYNQKFKDAWKEKLKGDWLISTMKKEPYCKVCSKKIKGGITHVQRHANSDFHKKQLRAAQSTIKSKTAK